MSRISRIVHIFSFVALVVSVFSPVLNMPVAAEDVEADPGLATPVVAEPKVEETVSPANPEVRDTDDVQPDSDEDAGITEHDKGETESISTPDSGIKITESSQAEGVTEPTVGRGPARETSMLRTMSAGGGMSVSVSADSVMVSPGDTITYTILVTNNSGSDHYYTFTNDLPAGTSFSGATVPYPQLGDTCNYVADDHETFCGLSDGMVLYSGWSDQWTVSVTVDEDASDPEFCIDGFVMTVTGNWDGNNVASSFVDVDCGGSVLELSISDDVEEGSWATPGSYIIYTISVTNRGDVAVSGNPAYHFEQEIPGSEFPATVDYPPGAICVQIDSPRHCRWSGTLAAGATHSYTFRYLVDSPDTEAVCENGQQAVVRWRAGTANATDQVATVNTPVLCAGLAMQVAGPTSVAPGEEFAYTVEVDEPTSVDSHHFSFDLQLPTGIMPSQPLPPDCVYERSSAVITCENVDPPNNATYVFDFHLVADVSAGAEACSVVTIGATGGNGDWAYDSRTAASTIHITGDCDQGVSLSVTADKRHAVQGQDVTYTIVVTNNGPNRQYDYMTLEGRVDPMVLTASAFEEHGHEAVVCQNHSGLVNNLKCYLPGLGAGQAVSFTITYPVRSDINPATCVETDMWFIGAKGDWNEASLPPNGVYLPLHVNCDSPLVAEVNTNTGGEVVAGEDFIYTLDVANTGTMASDDYALTIPLPAGVVLGDIVVPDGASCEPLRADGVTTIECFGTHVPARSGEGDGQHTYTFTMRTSQDSNNANCGATLEIPVTGSWRGQNSAQASITVICPPILGLSLTDDVSDSESVRLNQPFTYTVTVTNSGSTTDGGFSFENQLPAGVVLVDKSPISHPAGTTCTPTESGGVTVITCSGDSVPIGVGNGREFTFTVMAVDMIGGNINAAACDGVLNEVRGTVGVWSPEAQVMNLETAITCVSSLETSFEPLQSPVMPGETIGFTLTAYNSGDTRIIGLTQVPNELPVLPTGVWHESATLNGVDFDLDDFAGLETGDTLAVTIFSDEIPDNLSLPESDWCTTWRSEFTTTAWFTWGVEQQESDVATVQVNCTSVDVTQQVAFDGDSNYSGDFAPGDAFTYNLQAVNQGNTDISGVHVLNTIDSALSIDSATWSISGNEGTCTVTGQGIDCGPIDLSHGKSLKVVVDVAVKPVGSITRADCERVSNRAQFVAPEIDLLSNELRHDIECATGVTVELTGVSKDGGDGRIDAGDMIEYTISVINIGDVAEIGVVASDPQSRLDWLGDSEIGTMDPGETVEIRANYVVTQADLDAGSAYVCVNVRSNDLAPVEGCRDTSLVREESISIEIFEESEQARFASVTNGPMNTHAAAQLVSGDLVGFRVSITNTGNVTLSDVDVSGAGLVWASDSTIASIAPGESVDLLAMYQVRQSEIDAGELNVCAEVRVIGADGNAIEESACVISLIERVPPGVIDPTGTPTPDPTASETPSPEVPTTPESTATSTPVILATPDSTAVTAPGSDATDSETTTSVTSLPETGSGDVVSIASVLWVAAVLGVAAIGVGGIGIRRNRT